MGFGEKMTSGNHLVLVTGGTRGLGKLIAERFWQYGDDLILLARNEGDLKKIINDLENSAKGSQQVHCFTFDLSDIGNIPNLIKNIQNTAGNPDIVINNAAIQGPIGPVQLNNWDEWVECLNVCLLAPVQLCRGFLPEMIEKKFGRIVNISGGGATTPRPNFSSYSTAKCGLVRFSETLAHEVAQYNIRVNCVAPGAMNSNLTRQILQAGKEYAGQKELDSAFRLLKEDPGTIIRAVDLVHFLTTDSCSHINGKLISAVWDLWEKIPRAEKKFLESDVFTLRRIIPENWNMK